MSFIINKQLNADAQEGSVPMQDREETAAKTNVPVEAMETNETATEEIGRAHV